MALATSTMTLEQFLQLPEGEPPFEFAEGVVTQKVSPKGQHSALQAELLERLSQGGRQGHRARAFPELRITFAGAARVPDIAVYRRERIPRDEQGRIANDFYEPPDIAIEIASPEQSVNGLVRKCLWYVANGVSLALLVDPADESVLACDATGRITVWSATDRIDLGAIVPDFELTVEELFASLR
ncbi:MAG: Uma2 family endonuclease [Chloroflexota bacterium]